MCVCVCVCVRERVRERDRVVSAVRRSNGKKKKDEKIKLRTVSCSQHNTVSWCAGCDSRLRADG